VNNEDEQPCRRRIRSLSIVLRSGCTRWDEIVQVAPQDVRDAIRATELTDGDCMISCLDDGLAEEIGRIGNVGRNPGDARSPAGWFAARQCGLKRLERVNAAHELQSPFRRLAALNPQHARDVLTTLGLVVCASVAAHTRDTAPLRVLGRHAGERALDTKAVWERLVTHTGLISSWASALPLHAPPKRGESFARAVGIAVVSAQTEQMSLEHRETFFSIARWDAESALRSPLDWPACTEDAFADTVAAAFDAGGHEV